MAKGVLAMKLYSILIFVVLFVTQTVSPLFAEARPLIEGGVSDGGGNAIGDTSVSPENIAEKIPDLKYWILSWIYKNQAESSAQYMELFRQGSIEVRLTAPCFDKNGVAKDGSIYGGEKYQICLSAFLLSQKLSKSNYEAELAALMIHEFSHFLGTTEDEAVALQTKTAEDFSQLNLAETRKKILSFLEGPQGGLISKVYGPMESWQQDPQTYTTARDLLYWNQKWSGIYEELTNNSRGLVQYLPNEYLSVFPAYNIKIAVMIAFYHANDPHQTSDFRKQFQDNLDDTFAEKPSMTAREFIRNREGWDPGSDYEQVILTKPSTWSDQAQAMADIVHYLKSLEAQVRETSQFHFSVFKK